MAAPPRTSGIPGAATRYATGLPPAPLSSSNNNNNGSGGGGSNNNNGNSSNNNNVHSSISGSSITNNNINNSSSMPSVALAATMATTAAATTAAAATVAASSTSALLGSNGMQSQFNRPVPVLPTPRAVGVMPTPQPSSMPPSTIQRVRPLRSAAMPSAIPSRTGMPPGSELDMAEFPVLTNPSGLPSKGLLGHGHPQHSPEFTIQNEDFPALPGSAPSSSSRTQASSPPDFSHIQDGMKSMHLQGQYMGMGMDSNYPSRSDKTSLHDPSNPSQREVEKSESRFDRKAPGGPTTSDGVTAANNVTYGALSAGLVGPSSRGGAGAPSPSTVDRFGLLGLMNVIRTPEHDLNTLAIGVDLTSLGLNLNSSKALYPTFSSPWSDTPCQRSPEFRLPSCYYLPLPLPFAMSKITLLSDETLFYIFYSMPHDSLQEAAAQELYNRNWRYHKESQLWLTRDPTAELTAKTNTYEFGTYIYFQPDTWSKVRSEFKLMYEALEERFSAHPS